MMQTAYIGIDLHAKNFVQAVMDESGRYCGEWKYRAGEASMIRHVMGVEAKQKIVIFEASASAFWAARTVRPYATEVIVSDPRRNALISSNASKNDIVDAYSLCRLARLGELHQVYEPADDHRAVFKTTVLQYLDLRNQQVAIKQKLKARFREYGVFDLEGKAVYSEAHRQRFIRQLELPSMAGPIGLLYDLLDATLPVYERSKESMFSLGSRYPEIKEFVKMSGMGPVGSHVFDGIIQTPYRFKKKSQLWRHSKLGIRDRRSDNKPLGYQKLDKAGHGELKALSHRTWKAAMRKREPNEVRTFFEASLARTQSRTKARLNTQRKILTALWKVWLHKREYDPALFLGSGQQ